MPQPKAVECSRLFSMKRMSFRGMIFIEDFACPKGQTFDQETLQCKKCSEGSFSLGGGLEYTFDSLENIKSLPKEISLKTESLIGSYDTACKTKK